jgi:hypothetical protein
MLWYLLKRKDNFKRTFKSICLKVLWKTQYFSDTGGELKPGPPEYVGNANHSMATLHETCKKADRDIAYPRMSFESRTKHWYVLEVAGDDCECFARY